jgi:TM2 domain-containing membrane protein YozV
MFCRNCGNDIDPKAFVCVKCGVRTGVGSKYCANCGTEKDPGSSVCPRCGFVGVVPPAANPLQKSRIAAGLMGILIGSLGVHNFYLGYTGKGIAQLLLTLLSCGFLYPISYVWGLIEGIMILTNNITEDALGVPLRE